MALLPREIWAESARLGPFQADLASDFFFFRNALLILIIL
jgi:hypothetical protein